MIAEDVPGCVAPPVGKIWLFLEVGRDVRCSSLDDLLARALNDERTALFYQFGRETGGMNKLIQRMDLAEVQVDLSCIG